LLFSITLAASAADAQLEKVLVPVYNNRSVAGANGSLFSTALFVYQPDRSQILQVQPQEAPVIAHGRFFFFDKDTPVAATVNGIELPVVRERDVRTGLTTLMPLPVTPVLSTEDPSSPEHFHLLGYAERYAIRIYDWDSTGSAEVAVRLVRGFFLAQGAVGEVRVRLDRRDADDPSYPFYAEVDPQKAFPSWCYPGLHVACTPFPAIIEVEPLTPGVRYYAFASRTDNTTNQITLFTPR
jgi:hypothetical protein